MKNVWLKPTVRRLCARQAVRRTRAACATGARRVLADCLQLALLLHVARAE